MTQVAAPEHALAVDDLVRSAIATIDLSAYAVHDHLRDVIRGYVGRRVPVPLTDPATTARRWREMADRLGVPALAVPEIYGGAGFSCAETAVVAEELGRRLAHPQVVTSAAIAGSLLLPFADDTVTGAWLSRLATGELLAALACDAAVTGRSSAQPVTASLSPRGWLLAGQQEFVYDGDVAQLHLVVADTTDGPALFGYELPEPGVHVEPLPSLDLTRGTARLRWTDAAATLIAGPDDLAPALDRALVLGAVVLAAEQLGGADECLRMLVDHAGSREQFGRPIGSFQAIAHTAADLLVAVETARSLVRFAVAATAEDHPALPAIASMAKSYCSEVFCAASAENVQIHGGMGFTWEHPAHLYFRRARSTAVLLGDPAQHRRTLSSMLGLQP